MKFVNLTNEFTFNDIFILPRKTHFPSDVRKIRIDIKSKITKNLTISMPIISAPMQSVTEAKMASTIGQMGGIGFIHPYQKNDKQVEQIFETKLHHVKVGATVVNFNKDNITHVENLLKAGADILLFDSANAHSVGLLKFITNVKKRFPKSRISAGVVVTKEAVEDLIKAGADNIRVGIGAGSHCTTRLATGIGRPQLSTLYECSRVAEKYQIPILSDGGIKYPGDIVKAIVFGADAVMIGGLFAGTIEAPGKIIKIDGRRYKYSAGSTTQKVLTYGKTLKVNDKIKLRTDEDTFNFFNNVRTKYFEEGVEGVVEYKGSVKDIIKILVTGMIRSMWYQGVDNLSDLRKCAEVVKVTHNAFLEGLPKL